LANLNRDAGIHIIRRIGVINYPVAIINVEPESGPIVIVRDASRDSKSIGPGDLDTARLPFSRIVQRIVVHQPALFDEIVMALTCHT